MTTQIITVEDRRNELLNSLRPELRDFVGLFGIKEETLKLLGGLPQGEFSYFNGNIVPFGEGKYIPDFLDKMICAKSQYQVYSLIKTIKDSTEVLRKKILIYCDSSTKKGLWLDCRTQKHSLYVGSVDIHAKESTYFVSGSFFPDKI